MLFPPWLGFCLLFCIFFLLCISSHVIICIASALVAVIVLKLAFTRSCRFFRVSVDLLSDQPDHSLLSLF